jgi:hypothetical protein
MMSECTSPFTEALIPLTTNDKLAIPSKNNKITSGFQERGFVRKELIQTLSLSPAIERES